MKKYFLVIALWLCSAPLLNAQPHYAQVLAWLEGCSPTLQLLQQQKEAEQAAALSGGLFEDPEVEFAYLWRSPDESLGNRWDLKVTQSLEMPSVYVHKARIRQLQSLSAEGSWQFRRQQLLLEAQQVCAAMVYYNACERFYMRCEQSAQQVVDLYQKRFDEGDCSVLDYNRVQLARAEIHNKLEMVRLERDAMADNLALLAGGASFPFNEALFPEQHLPADFNQWYDNAVRQCPRLQQALVHFQQSEQQLALSKAQWLPRLSLGYASENTLPEVFRGVAVGLNIPLWNKSHTVKSAKMELQAAYLEQSNLQLRHRNHLKSLFHKAKALEAHLQSMQQALYAYNSESLLIKALNAGEMTLEDYLRSVEFYHDTEASLLEVRYALEQTALQLNADAL